MSACLTEANAVFQQIEGFAARTMLLRISLRVFDEKNKILSAIPVLHL